MVVANTCLGYDIYIYICKSFCGAYKKTPKTCFLLVCTTWWSNLDNDPNWKGGCVLKPGLNYSNGPPLNGKRDTPQQTLQMNPATGYTQEFASVLYLTVNRCPLLKVAQPLSQRWNGSTLWDTPRRLFRCYQKSWKKAKVTGNKKGNGIKRKT